jgi:hypothetical protein
MKYDAEKLQNSVPRLVDRLMLRMSTARVIDGLWVGTFESDAEPILCKLEKALSLIKIHYPIRYNRVIRDLDRVWVLIVPGGVACFSPSLRACKLDTRMVLSEEPEEVAASIVHEATHARLRRHGIGYEENLRHRIEALCFRQEIAFARKLPNGEQVREGAHARLSAYGPEYWTDEACSNRSREHDAEAYRYLFPEWLVRPLMIIRDAVRYVQRRS